MTPEIFQKLESNMPVDSLCVCNSVAQYRYTDLHDLYSIVDYIIKYELNHLLLELAILFVHMPILTHMTHC